MSIGLALVLFGFCIAFASVFIVLSLETNYRKQHAVRSWAVIGLFGIAVTFVGLINLIASMLREFL